MNFIVLAVLLVYLNVVATDETDKPRRDRVIRLWPDDGNDERRSFSRSNAARFNVNDLPKNSPNLPGHSLIRPAKTMLKSAVKFPQDDINLVYGNLDNLGITYDQSGERLITTGFRKESDFAQLLKTMKQINEKKTNDDTNSLYVLKPKSNPISTAAVGSKLHKITMKAMKILNNQEPILVTPGPKAKPETSAAKKLKEITTKALDFIGNEDSRASEKKKTPLILFKSKYKPAEKLKEITSKALNYIHFKSLDPIIEPMKDLDISDEKKQNGKLVKKALQLLTSGNKKPKKKPTMKDRIKKKEEERKEMMAQDLLNARGQIAFDLPHEETLRDKSQRIQDFLNSHIPVMNVKSYKQDTSRERAQKVNDFLENQIPGGKASLTLDEKSQFIEDYLNNRVPIFINADAFKKHPRYIPTFSIGQNSNFNNAFNSNTLNSTRINKNLSDNISDNVDTNHQTTMFSIPAETDEEENNANEVLDHYSNESEEEQSLEVWHPNFRRKGKATKKFRKRDSKYISKTDGDSDVSASSDYEKNPGNPFTIHRNKYLQNWMWNHNMDGDHMNINPFGPPFATLGPSGADLFFGRKWWYYNQDDYKPMG